MRSAWSENTRNLDQLFPEVMATLFKAAVLARRRHLKQIAEAEVQRKRENELEQLRHRIDEEENRVNALVRAAENWRKAREIREYVLAVIEAKRGSGEELGPDTLFGIWAVWALQQSDRLDPLAKRPPSILDHKKELPPANKGWWSR